MQRLVLLIIVIMQIYSEAYTQQTIPWTEDFSDVSGGELPPNWIGDSENHWQTFNTNNAGGESPELLFWWQPVGAGRYELLSPEINTIGFERLTFSFRSRIRNFGDPGIYTLSIYTISGDGQQNLITEWINPDFIPAELLSFTLTEEEHGIGDESLNIMWVFEGNTGDISAWELDDISLTAPAGEGEISISPETFSFPDRQIGTASPDHTFTIKNIGTSAVSLEPENISIQSVNAQSIDLDIMTYNIWFDSQNWPARMNYMLSEIRAKDPDVICLQEVIQRPGLQNQAQTLADSLGYHFIFASVDGPSAPTRFGNAILSKYPIIEDNWKALLPLNDFRKVIHARIVIEGNVLDIYNTHLHNTGAGNQIRATQITDLKGFIASTRADNSYVFLCGDFNSNPN